jgi:hypothetical protein
MMCHIGIGVPPGRRRHTASRIVTAVARLLLLAAGATEEMARLKRGHCAGGRGSTSITGYCASGCALSACTPCGFRSGFESEQ